jgi:DNA-binding FrmR family transcriptional regulator
VTLLLLEDHVAGCLTTAVKTGDAAPYTEEVMEVVRRSMGRPARASRPAGDS